MPEPLAPLAPTTSYFEILGVPAFVDAATLAQKFREKSRLYHPDRFVTADQETQAVALDASALINDAYRTLRDPFTRAEYLLRRERGTRPDDLKDTAKPPQELFVQVLELQEALMEFHEARMDDDEETVVRLLPTLQEARTEFQTAYDALKDRLLLLFAEWDTGRDREATLDALAMIMGTRGYLRRVLGNMTTTLGAATDEAVLAV